MTIKQFLATVYSPSNLLSSREKLEIAIALLREVDKKPAAKIQVNK